MAQCDALDGRLAVVRAGRPGQSALLLYTRCFTGSTVLRCLWPACQPRTPPQRMVRSRSLTPGLLEQRRRRGRPHDGPSVVHVHRAHDCMCLTRPTAAAFQIHDTFVRLVLLAARRAPLDVSARTPPDTFGPFRWPSACFVLLFRSSFKVAARPHFAYSASQPRAETGL